MFVSKPVAQKSYFKNHNYSRFLVNGRFLLGAMITALIKAHRGLNQIH